MALVVEKDKPLDPMGICFLGAVTVVAGPNRLADLVEQLELCCAGRRRNGFGVHKPALHRQTDPSDRESGWGNFHLPFCPTYRLIL